MLHARRVRELTGYYNIPLIIDDFPEVAVEVGAAGVHLGRNDPSVSKIRQEYGNKLIIGASAYCDPDLALKLQQDGADYVGFSTPFKSKTKSSAPECPLSAVTRARELLSIPIFMVGGITLENIDQVHQTRVEGFAVSWGLFGAGDPEETARHFVNAWRDG